MSILLAFAGQAGSFSRVGSVDVRTPRRVIACRHLALRPCAALRVITTLTDADLTAGYRYDCRGSNCRPFAGGCTPLPGGVTGTVRRPGAAAEEVAAMTAGREKAGATKAFASEEPEGCDAFTAAQRAVFSAIERVGSMLLAARLRPRDELTIGPGSTITGERGSDGSREFGCLRNSGTIWWR